MKLILLLLIFQLTSYSIFAQVDKVNDSLIEEICTYLTDNNHLEDKVRYERIKARYIYPIIYKIKNSKRDEAINFISARLQRNCKEFDEMVERLNPPKGDWVRIDKKQTSSLSKEVCEDFLKIGEYYYFGADGEKVYLTIENNIWEDHFLDNTYSKLNLSWTDTCEFEIEFVESNNKIRRNFSKPGDKYKYQILEKDDNYYKLSVEIVQANQFFTFKLYYR